ncbi:hypothetical protein EWM58_12110 [Candidatus Erwinia dacicola]|nr:hypothetical protein [Candidatus Erwinia dacicola]
MHDVLFVGEDAHHIGTLLHLFVQALQRVRGLEGVKLVISDAHSGLK